MMSSVTKLFVSGFRKIANFLCRSLSKSYKNRNEKILTKTNASQKITNNLQFYGEKVGKDGVDPVTLRLSDSIDKPLVIILSWLMAKRKHISKYVEIYNELGFDVVAVTVTAYEFLWPTRGTQLVAADLLRFLENNALSNPLLLHGFSVGGYLWGECLVQMARDMKRYSGILNRISGQIWDSVAGVTEISVGIPKAVFPKNQFMEMALRGYILFHTTTFHEQSTKHYLLSSHSYHQTLVRSPALFLLSKTDPIGTFAASHGVKESWESLGIACTWKCWDRSPHVGHFRRHREEYMSAWFDHLKSIGMIKAKL